MATPARPQPDTIISSEWGGWVHDSVVYRCTSTTRPTSPQEGMVVYELDTDSVKVYAGATTGWVPPWNQPWGVVKATANGTNGYGFVRLTGAIQGTTAQEVAAVEFNAVANRLYRVHAHADMNSTVNATGQLQIKLDGNAIATGALAITQVGQGNDRFPTVDTVFTTTTGPHRVVVTAGATGGTWTLVNIEPAPLIFTVEDAGPVGPPA